MRNMKKNNLKYLMVLLTGVFSFTACVGDLDVTPINPQVTQTFLQDDVFAKVYASFSHTGQEGPSGKGDIEGLDEGRFSLVRCLWNCNELCTDEAICSWGDAEVIDLNKNSWTPNNNAFDGLYARLYFVITISNHFLEQTADITDEKTVKQKAEVRFLRALAYYFLLDNFGNVPFIDKISDIAPPQIKRKELFKWIESELKAVEPDMYEPKTGPYYRVDKAACWLLLARLYLNGEIYTAVPASDGVAAVAGTTFWNEAAVYAHKVINSSYALSPVFKHLFMGDNAGVIDGSATNLAAQEIIFPFPADGVKTTSWGSSLFLIASTHTSGMAEWGTSEGWGGNRLRPSVTRAFFPGTILVKDKKDLTSGLTSSSKDERALIYGDADRTLSIPNIGKFKEGYSAIKFSNVRSDFGGVLSVSASGTASSGTGSYTGVTGTTSGTGKSATFTVNKADGTYSVTITNLGLGYKANDTIFVSGATLGGTVKTNDLKIIVVSAIKSHDVKYVDMDYPFMRKAEAYLIYAEAVLRGASEIESYKALDAMNALRNRAKAKNYTTVTIDDILTERVREFFMEGHRRTDLIRFNKFGGTTGYTWEWKGGEQAGVDFPVEYNLFPLPTNDLNANPNLTQNPGY
jgi:hypothetical protein